MGAIKIERWSSHSVSYGSGAQRVESQIEDDGGGWKSRITIRLAEGRGAGGLTKCGSSEGESKVIIGRWGFKR